MFGGFRYSWGAKKALNASAGVIADGAGSDDTILTLREAEPEVDHELGAADGCPPPWGAWQKNFFC